MYSLEFNGQEYHFGSNSAAYVLAAFLKSLLHVGSPTSILQIKSIFNDMLKAKDEINSKKFKGSVLRALSVFHPDKISGRFKDELDSHNTAL